jgi:large subunit ribosomal protein L21
VLRITEILTDNAKPSIGPRPKREKVVAPAAEGDEAPKKAPAKKAVAKKAVAKKAPAKKAAAKK